MSTRTTKKNPKYPGTGIRHLQNNNKQQRIKKNYLISRDGSWVATVTLKTICASGSLSSWVNTVCRLPDVSTLHPTKDPDWKLLKKMGNNKIIWKKEKEQVISI